METRGTAESEGQSDSLWDALSGTGEDTSPRSQALQAVLRSAAREGFVHRSLREIAPSSGISHRMLIYHFGSQAGLWEAVMAFVSLAERRVAAAERPYCADAAQVERYLLGRWQRFSQPVYLAYFRLFFELYGFALTDPKGMFSHFDGVIPAWAEPAAVLFGEIGFAPAEAKARARLLVAGVRGLMLDLLTLDDRAAVDAAAALLCRVLTQPTCPP